MSCEQSPLHAVNRAKTVAVALPRRHVNVLLAGREWIVRDQCAAARVAHATCVPLQTHAPVFPGTLALTVIFHSVCRHVNTGAFAPLLTPAVAPMVGSMPIAPHRCARKHAGMEATAPLQTRARARMSGMGTIVVNPPAPKNVFMARVLLRTHAGATLDGLGTTALNPFVHRGSSGKIHIQGMLTHH